MKLKARTITIISILLSIFVWIFLDLFLDGSASQELLFVNNLDTGMDFFSSILYTQGTNPYMGFDTVYPLLANFFMGYIAFFHHI
ncbi:hypothetical protein [Lachnospira pectinoschiza]|uniref:Uncharacterized protein n=1 Tax=Lachnospira pectinoschiza TaxID=28052 RepID=A0A1G9SSQ2_9FIRM|nr:hypothetical protein [Lachnospira pectinoschiza]SDM38499.1 hypothetical protein SAMN05216544_0078 [Lachnospira pectinoschiza]